MTTADGNAAFITADRIKFNDDGTEAWWVGDDPPAVRDSVFSSRRFASDLDRPCDTCWGHRSDDYHPSYSCSAKCIDGRHTFEIEVGVTQEVCPACKMSSIGASISGEKVAAWRCLACDHRWTGKPLTGAFPRTFRVSVVPDMVLPIVAWSRSFPDAFVTPDGDQWRYYPTGVKPERDDTHYIPLPPATDIGMWAVKLKVAA